MAEFEAEKPVFNFFSKCIKLALSSSKKKKNKPQTSLSKNVRNSPETRKMPRKYVAVENWTDFCFPLAFRRVLLPQRWLCKTPPAVNPTVPKRCPREPGWLGHGHVTLGHLPALDSQAQTTLPKATLLMSRLKAGPCIYLGAH